MSKWNAPSAWTAMSVTNINGLASTASAASSTAITNGSTLDIFIDLALTLGSITPGTAPAIEIHLLPLMADGSSYAEISRADDVRPLSVSTSAKYVMAQGLRLGPGTYLVAIVNQAGVALAASSNALSFRTYSPA